MKFDNKSDKAIVIMYPTGGYGNFLYKILTEHFESTVKINSPNFVFSDTGDSHKFKKYTEVFALGTAMYTHTLKSFKYDFQITNPLVLEQIKQNKHFLILADVGNTADNVKFLKTFFPNAKIVRVYAETFEEKFVVWANCIYKSVRNLDEEIYKTSMHTIKGIAQFANIPQDQVTDQHAIDCLTNFLMTNFGKYGKFFSKPSTEINVINFPFKNFLNKDDFINSLKDLAKNLNTNLINIDLLEKSLDEFYRLQKYLISDLHTINDPIITPALMNYYKGKNV